MFASLETNQARWLFLAHVSRVLLQGCLVTSIHDEVAAQKKCISVEWEKSPFSWLWRNPGEWGFLQDEEIKTALG